MRITDVDACALRLYKPPPWRRWFSPP